MPYFHRYPHPDHFAYPEALHKPERLADGLRYGFGAHTFEIHCYKGGVVRLQLRRGDERPNPSVTRLDLEPAGDTLAVQSHQGHDLAVCERVEVRVDHRPAAVTLRVDGRPALVSAPGRLAGTCGDKSIFCFSREAGMPFLGMGEKTGRYNKAGGRVKFYNTDVLADFPGTHMHDDYDPGYASIPVLYTRGGGGYVGLYYHNPCHCFFDLGHQRPDGFHLGSYQGPAELYVLPGPGLPEVVRAFAALTGRMELPPRWTLGYQQCRWGYKSEADIAQAVQQAERHDVPVAGMWLDIDHMVGYRVFTWDLHRFPSPERLAEDLEGRGIRLVTIVDPGVKRDETFELYREGVEQDLFCKTAEGTEYVGRVWPGDTVFPDFTLPECRAWWADKVAGHLRRGLAGIWIDMNDPSTGAEPEDLLFQRGAAPHIDYHSQYANLMAEATFDGFARFDPGARPFILTRSASTGIQRHSTMWTGDNHSRWEHLRMSIPMSLNLSLSGVAFNGPDVPGFVSDTDEELARRWFQAGFLFPFLRNHSCIGTRAQEPWAFSEQTLAAIRGAICTRCKLLPYLYTLFHDHLATGEPVMRPLGYEFPDPAYDSVNDQFLIGSSILLAPIVWPGARDRSLFLPPGMWFDFGNCGWRPGQREPTGAAWEGDHLALFFRDGAILPVCAGTTFANAPDFSTVEFHVFCHDTAGRLVYHEDDGETRSYRKGNFNRWEVSAEREGGTVVCTVRRTHRGYDRGLTKAVLVLEGPPPDRWVVNGDDVAARPSWIPWPIGGYAGCRTELELEEAK